MSLWQRYVRDVAGSDTQETIAAKAGVNQTTVSRWLRDNRQPTEAAKVAAFARGYRRNVLEAFVAAGMLTEADALSGLPDDSRRYLHRLRRMTTAQGTVVRARSSRS